MALPTIQARLGIRETCIANPDRELCGLILGNSKVIVCDNIAADPTKEFEISAEDWAKASVESTITQVWHSHIEPFDQDFSPADIHSSYALETPFYLFHVPTAKERYFDPEEILPFEGREWTLYRNCYTLAADVLRTECGISLKPFIFDEPEQWARPDFIPWLAADVESQGFREIPLDSPIQQYDIFLMKMPGQVYPCHIGIMINPDLNQFLHHLTGRLSEKAVWGGWWAQTCEKRYRHEAFMQAGGGNAG